jgi:glycosyltransferase involved in cell wall biosynthesis
MQGNTLAAALRGAGEDVLLVPVYTPLRTDEEDVSLDRVVFGGVNVYLQQHSALFRHTPWALDRLLDRPGLLRWLSRRAMSTRPERLGALTVSMLRGEEGRQRKEVKKLADWLGKEIRPELVHLSNVLLVGMARELRRQLGVPVVCSVSGEDGFLEGLAGPHYAEARAVLRERSADLDAVVSMSRYYADFMAEYLPVPRERIHVVPAGLNLSGHGPREEAETSAAAGERPATIGYLSRIAPEKGLHRLAEAFTLLTRQEGLPPVRLVAAGYMDGANRPYLDEIQAHLAEAGLADRFEYAGELDRAAKIAFLQSLDLMSVPAVHPESKGLAVLEAWANAVPVVLPDHGAFSEMVEDSGGGLLYAPENPEALAAALRRMIDDRALAAECGARAREFVHREHGAALAAERTMAFYRSILTRGARRPARDEAG